MSCLSHFEGTFAPYALGSGAETPRARSGKEIPARYGEPGREAEISYCYDAWRSRSVSSASTFTWSPSCPTATIW